MSRKKIRFDVRPGDVVLLEQGAIGVVKYFGPVHFANGNMIGVELHSYQNILWQVCDGSIDGRRYFDCDKSCGIFVSQVKKVVNAASLLEKLIEVYEDNRIMTLALSKMKFDFERLEHQTETVSKSFGQNWSGLLLSTRSQLASPTGVDMPSSVETTTPLTTQELNFYRCLDDSDDEM